MRYSIEGWARECFGVSYGRSQELSAIVYVRRRDAEANPIWVEVGEGAAPGLRMMVNVAPLILSSEVEYVHEVEGH